MSGMCRNTIVSVACCLLIASTCAAAKKRITLKDGRVIVGEVVGRTDKVLRVKLKIAEVSYPLDKIESIEDVVSPKTEYAGRLAKIDPKNANAQIGLGQWALKNKMYKEAVERLEAALAIDEGNFRAKLLLRQAKSKLAEESDSGTGATGTADASSNDTSGASSYNRAALVTDDDVNRIRLAEIRENDRVSIRFRENVVSRYTEKMAGRGDFAVKGFDARFRKLSSARKVVHMRRNLDASDPLLDNIAVRGDPASMKLFRTRIWRMVAGSCATSSCHGAAKGQGGLKLFNVGTFSDNIDYTNFLILDSFHTKSGRKMIDRDEHEKSLLLQFGLPPGKGMLKHKKKLRPMHGSQRSGSYIQALAWIKQLKGPRHPGYGIKKRPPNVMERPSALPLGPSSRPSGATTQPAKSPDMPF
jgi:hypothetical protein